MATLQDYLHCIGVEVEAERWHHLPQVTQRQKQSLRSRFSDSRLYLFYEALASTIAGRQFSLGWVGVEGVTLQLPKRHLFWRVP